MLASLRLCDTYALNLSSLWGRFNGECLPLSSQRILIAGCGTFSHYPFGIANPDSAILGLDLSEASLAKARLHARIHGCRNVSFLRGNLLHAGVAPGPFQFIDAYGVLHHLASPLAGLNALAERLEEGGILRLMVYSRGARGAVESVRRAFRLLGVRDVVTGRNLVRRAAPESRLAECVRSLPEARTACGFADAFLHPSVHPFRVDELMSMVADSKLQPLLFAHPGALTDIGSEVERLRKAEDDGEVHYNYTLYLGRNCKGGAPLFEGSRLLLNPALRRVVTMPRLFPVRVDDRLGAKNPVLGRGERRFLRRFVTPTAISGMAEADLSRAKRYLDCLFLYCVR